MTTAFDLIKGAATYYDTHQVNLRTQYNELKSRFDIHEIPF